MKRNSKSVFALVGLALSISVSGSTLANADEAKPVHGTVHFPVVTNPLVTNTQVVARGATATDTTMVLPSDEEVIRMAERSGAKMTRGGVVQPKNKLKDIPNGPIALSVPLTEEEKMLEEGKPETNATRGQTAYGYIFIKPQNVAGLGHIGWGYWAPNMNYYVCGSTENYSAAPYIGAGGNNGYWSAAFYTEGEMFRKFKQMGYYAFKRKMVSSPNPDAAWGRACYTRNNGFRGVGWNCLDHTYYILEGYGVTGMPWKQTNPAPNGWFNAFPGTGYQLP